MREIILNNGVKMPLLGLGVYQTTGDAEMRAAVDAALEAGYRCFDTAQMYKNEHVLGKALDAAGAPRDTLFLTSKVDLDNMGYENTLASFQQSLEKLRTDYLDLFLIHWPGQQQNRLLDTWRAMETLCAQKKVRAIGVCNCQPRHLQWILDACETAPAVNQVERHPLLNERTLIDWCVPRRIALQAWAPLLRGNLDHPEIMRLAHKHGKTPAQVVLRWDIQSGVAVIPKSVRRERIFENAAIFDFDLEPEDMAVLDGMDTGAHTSHDPETFDF